MKQNIYRFVAIVLLLIMNSCSSKSEPIVLTSFCKENPEFGHFKSSKEMPNWAEGKRFQIETDKGTYLAYLIDDEVVTLYEYQDSNERNKVFEKKRERKEELNKNVKLSQIPKYSVIFKTKLFSGTGDYIEVLIPNFDKKIDSKGKKELFKAILENEKSISGTFYLTEEAQKANSSDSFKKRHPHALKDGYLGDITEKGELLE